MHCYVHSVWIRYTFTGDYVLNGWDSCIYQLAYVCKGDLMLLYFVLSKCFLLDLVFIIILIYLQRRGCEWVVFFIFFLNKLAIVNIVL